MADPTTVAGASSSRKCNDGHLNAASSSRESVLDSDTREITSSPSSNGHFVLKRSTCLWKRADLLALKIRVYSPCETTPLDIVNLIDIHHIAVKSLLMGKAKLQDLSVKLDGRLKFLANEIKTTFAHQLMIKSFDELTVSDVLFEHDDIWKLRSENIDDEKYFSASFQVYGRAFFRFLRNCLYHRDEQKKDLTDDMYQHLFVNFLQVFGVKCQFAPLIPTTSIRIRGQKISGAPEIIGKFNVKENGKYKQKTLCVCKVKKRSEGEELSPKRRRLSSQSESCPVLSDALLGQHGGELLLHYQSSVAENAVIGLIVENTHVTFSALQLTDTDFNKLIDGSLKLKNNVGPKLIFTRPYNFMVKEDRDHLIEPLLKLGFIQDIGSVY